MSKVSLQQVGPNSYYCDGIFSIGVYVHNNNVLLIDSGSDNRSAKDAYNAVTDAGFTITAIINTHCHPDHCAGNSFFTKMNPDIQIYAAYDEKIFMEDSLMAPRCFYGGAMPIAGLQNKLLAPQQVTPVTNIIMPYADQTIDINGAHIKIVTLPGHTPGMIGVITLDNILYSGDALFGHKTLQKHPVLLYTDVEKTLETFDKIASLPIDAAVLYHGGVDRAVKELIKKHKEVTLEVQLDVYAAVQDHPLCIDMITQKIMQKHAIPDTIVAYTLTQTAVKAHITYLEMLGKVTITVVNGLMQVSCT